MILKSFLSCFCYLQVDCIHKGELRAARLSECKQDKLNEHKARKLK